MQGLLVLLLGASAAADPFVMLMKSISREQGVYAESIDVQLRVFNKGDSPAYAVSLEDGDWPASHFELVKGPKERVIAELEQNSSFTHTFTVRPTFAGVHTLSAATLTYSATAKGATLSYASNVPPALPIISRAEKYLNVALAIGRVLSLNFVRTLRGWVSVAAFWSSVFGLIALYKLNVKRQDWKYERAVKEMEKMK
ncbi:translocon-associated protein subunit beta [Pavlovales sp. CCMP2436]|nr:translocon-associated protein subunit beta [Pavlovales sp. CCMP2436]